MELGRLERILVERRGLELGRLERVFVELSAPVPVSATAVVAPARPRTPSPVIAVVTGAVAAGLAVLTVTGHVLAARSLPTAHQWTVLAVFGVLLVASWSWPLMILVGDESEAVHIDEYFVIVMLLLAPPATMVATFAVATVAGQIIRRRPLLKSAFNVGQEVVSAGVAALTFHFLSPGSAGVSYAALAAAILAATTFLVVNNALVGAVLAATGAPWRQALTSGMDIRIAFNVGSVAVACTTAVLASVAPDFLPVAVIPPVILRRVLADQFEARRDRARVRGLFAATLEANRSMGDAEVTDALLHAARELLRCTHAAITDRAEVDGGLSARLPLPDQHRWLAVWGRSRTEPFDDSDRQLLDALAAVATGALSNAWLYQEGQAHRERLATITAS
ncbi:MAG TPA: hypothetical protein VE991_04550, partial [Acidimicrobiales bacterium]|nr:hypothetical protein [Acidimicrobiales bacterium]